MRIGEPLRQWARRMKRDSVTLWFAAKHPGTPWHAKALGMLVVAYALSPIDLIPDFIPVLGYVDDVLLLPALIWLAVKLLPDQVRQSCRAEADEWLRLERARPRSRAGVLLVVFAWCCASVAAYWFFRDWL